MSERASNLQGRVHKCKDCPNRTIEPNCHHPDRCEYWARIEEEKARRYAQRQDEGIADAKDVKYAKQQNRGSYKAYFGTGNHFRSPRGHTILRGGGR